jgi:hypothetical protein
LAVGQKTEAKALAEEKMLQAAMLEIKKEVWEERHFEGLESGRRRNDPSRNKQIGGHKA